MLNVSGWQGTFREGQTWASLDSQLGANSPGGVGGRPREVLCVACSLTLRSLLKGQPVPKKAFPDPRSRPGRPRVCQDHRTDPSGTQVHLPTGPTAAPCPSLPPPAVPDVHPGLGTVGHSQGHLLREGEPQPQGGQNRTWSQRPVA